MNKYVSDFQTYSSEKLNKLYLSQQHELNNLTVEHAKHKPYHTYDGKKIGETKSIKRPKIKL